MVNPEQVEETDLIPRAHVLAVIDGALAGRRASKETMTVEESLQILREIFEDTPTAHSPTDLSGRAREALEGVARYADGAVHTIRDEEFVLIPRAHCWFAKEVLAALNPETHDGE